MKPDVMVPWAYDSLLSGRIGQYLMRTNNWAWLHDCYSCYRFLGPEWCMSALMGTRMLLVLRTEPSWSFAHFSCRALRILQRLSRGCWESFKQMCGFNHEKTLQWLSGFDICLIFNLEGLLQMTNIEEQAVAVMLQPGHTWCWALQLWLKT